MGAVSFSQKGNWSKTKSFLKKNNYNNIQSLLNKYGQDGVMALSAATPVDTGKTSDSWDYEITMDNKGFGITWTNSNAPGGIPVVILLQYGHATKNGHLVQGIDFINPAMKPIFDKMANDIWKEVNK